MHRIKTRTIRALLAILISTPLFVVVASTQPALANHFGTGCCTWADNGQHTFNWDSTEYHIATAISYSMANLDNQTDMTANWVTASSQTDNRSYDQHYTTYWGLDWDGSTTGWNLWAYTKCVEYTLAYNCQQYQIRYDLADLNSFSNYERQQVACHETGHSVGLDHSSERASCLQRSATDASTNAYTAHDRAHINGRW
jgi:Matrixin